MAVLITLYGQCLVTLCEPPFVGFCPFCIGFVSHGKLRSTTHRAFERLVFAARAICTATGRSMLRRRISAMTRLDIPRNGWALPARKSPFFIVCCGLESSTIFRTAGLSPRTWSLRPFLAPIPAWRSCSAGHLPSVVRRLPTPVLTADNRRAVLWRFAFSVHAGRRYRACHLARTGSTPARVREILIFAQRRSLLHSLTFARSPIILPCFSGVHRTRQKLFRLVQTTLLLWGSGCWRRSQASSHQRCVFIGVNFQLCPASAFDLQF